MNILILSQYFWPESFIINDFAKTLKGQGHKVVIATGKPNYPDGEVFGGYKVWGMQRETFDSNIDVMRVPLFPRGQGGALSLSLNYLSFVIAGFLLFPWLLRGRKFDSIVVFGMSPITQVIPAIPLKFIKRAHLAAWVQDLWPDSLAATGFVRNSLVLRMVGWMVRGIYWFCDTLLLQSRAFFAPVERYANCSKLVYYPNSMVAQAETEEKTEVPGELVAAIKASFSVVFAGNIGFAQSVETIVGAAERLQSQSDIQFYFVGGGSCLDWVRERKEALNLTNLTLAGRFPMESMPLIFKYSSALLVSLKDEEIFSYTIPSKVQAYLAAGKPIIASLRGEGAKVVVEAGAGVTCAPEDAEALATAIVTMKAMSAAERKAMGSAGKRYFDENFEMKIQANRLVEILSSRSHA